MKLDKMVRSVYPKLMPYVAQLADLPVEEMKQALGKDTVYKLSFNENPLGPSPKAVEAMQKALLDLNLYPSSNGEAVISRLAEKEGVQKENLILSNGADEMIVMVAQTFLEPGDEVVMPHITFVQYLASAHLMGATPVLAPMKDDLGVDLDAILARITPATKLVFLCNPNNPTGVAIPADELRAFVDKVPENVLVVIDEAYHEYAVDPEYRTSVDMVGQGKNVFVIRTFSKIYSLAAARIGYGMGPSAIVDAINHVRPPFNVNSIAQAGALASLDDTAHVTESQAINQQGKELITRLFDELGMKHLPSNTNFVCVDTGKDSTWMFEQLAERGVIVRNLAGYGMNTSLRVSIGKPEEMQAFVAAMKEIIEK